MPYQASSSSLQDDDDDTDGSQDGQRRSAEQKQAIKPRGQVRRQAENREQVPDNQTNHEDRQQDAHHVSVPGLLISN